MPADLSTEELRHAYPMAMVIISATEGSVERTVNCMCTPSDSANLHRTRTSAPPRNTPGKTWRTKTNKSLQQFLFHHGQRTNTPLVIFSIETLQFLFYPSLACLHWSGLVRLTFVVTPSRSSSPRPHLIIELTTPTTIIKNHSTYYYNNITSQGPLLCISSPAHEKWNVPIACEAAIHLLRPMHFAGFLCCTRSAWDPCTYSSVRPFTETPPQVPAITRFVCVSNDSEMIVIRSRIQSLAAINYCSTAHNIGTLPSYPCSSQQSMAYLGQRQAEGIVVVISLCATLTMSTTSDANCLQMVVY